MGVQVIGMGPVGGFGAGTGPLERVLDGSCKVVPELIPIEKDGRTLTQPCFRADISRLDEFIPPKKLRRVDHLASMALLGGFLAVKDAQLSPQTLERTGIILATGYGALDTGFAFIASFLDRGDQLSKPTFFSNSVHNAATAYLSIFLGIKGPSLSVSQFDLSVPSALMTAVNWIDEGRVDTVLVGGVDAYSDVLGYAAASMCESCKRGPEILGEGGCFFVLSKDCDAFSYARLTGVDIFDPARSPIRSPARSSISGSETQIIIGSQRAALGASVSPLSYESLSYESLYGNFPAAAALDMAVACLGLNNKRLLNRMTGKRPRAETILCLAPGNDHLWGKLTLESNQEEQLV